MGESIHLRTAEFIRLDSVPPGSFKAKSLGCICPKTFHGGNNEGRYVSPVCPFHTIDVSKVDDGNSSRDSTD